MIFGNIRTTLRMLTSRARASSEDVIDIFETQVLNDAMRCAKSGDYLPSDVLTPIMRVDDATGMRTTNFHGPSFIRQFKPIMRTMRIRTQREIVADQMRSY